MPNENWTLFLMNMFFVLCVDMCNSACNVCIMCTQCIFTPHFLSTYLKTRRWMSSIGAGCRGSESSPVSTTPRKYTTLCVSLQRYASRWYMNTHVVEKDAAGPVLPDSVISGVRWKGKEVSDLSCRQACSSYHQKIMKRQWLHIAATIQKDSLTQNFRRR